MQNQLIQYYQQRAQEYEKIYAKPERQADLSRASAILQSFFQNQEVIEIACGTGYWTEKIAATARFVWASDINESVLDIARQKHYPKSNVQFDRADLYGHFPEKQGASLFGGFIWSHIPVQELDHFLQATSRRVQPGEQMVFMDNLYVPGSSTPIFRQDELGNSYQQRSLADGTLHEVLKNFPTEAFLSVKFTQVAVDIEYLELDYFWILRGRKKE